MASTTFSGPVTSTNGFVGGAASTWADGTVSLPGIAFTSDPDTGIYRIGANNLGVAAAGAKVLDVSATGLGVTGTMLAGSGTVSLPGIGFSADTDCGLYRIGANNIGVAVNAAKVLDIGTAGAAVTGTFSATGVSTFAVGAVGAPSLTFTGDPNTGIYWVGADSFALAANGANVAVVSTAGVAVTGLVSATTTVTAGTNLVATGYIQNSVGAGLTAAGTTRADALQLAKGINVIGTAAAGTGVILPAAATVGVGGSVIVFNNGANLVQVYAPGSDTIDGVAGATGVALTNALRCVYIVTAANTYISAQLGVVSA